MKSLKAELEDLAERLESPTDLGPAWREYEAASSQLAGLVDEVAMSHAIQALCRLVARSRDHDAGDGLMSVLLLQFQAGALVSAAGKLVQELSRMCLDSYHVQRVGRRVDGVRKKHEAQAKSRKQSQIAKNPRPKRWGLPRRLCTAVFTERPSLVEASFEDFLTRLRSDDGHYWNGLRALERGDRWVIEPASGGEEREVGHSQLRRAWREEKKRAPSHG